MEISCSAGPGVAVCAGIACVNRVDICFLIVMCAAPVDVPMMSIQVLPPLAIARIDMCMFVVAEVILWLDGLATRFKSCIVSKNHPFKAAEGDGC